MKINKIFIVVLIFLSINDIKSQQTDSVLYQKYEYKDTLFKLSVLTNRIEVSKNDTLSLIINFENISGKNILIFDDYFNYLFVSSDDLIDKIIIDYGGEFYERLNNLISMLVVKPNISISKEFKLIFNKYAEINLNKYFQVQLSFGFLIDFEKIICDNQLSEKYYKFNNEYNILIDSWILETNIISFSRPILIFKYIE